MSKEYARKAALKYYYKIKADPDLWSKKKQKRQEWYERNRIIQTEKQKQKKRQRKSDCINYLGGVCFNCKSSFHPSVYEFHHRNPKEKDRDPSKLMLLKWETIIKELDKCDLLCANCHRLVHHTWENEFVQ